MSEQSDLFEARGMAPGLYSALVTLARQLLARAEAKGGGFDEVRMMAETRGLLTGNESGRFLSCGDAIMRSARGRKGVVVGYRRSRHPKSQRRRIALHVHEQFVSQIQQGAA